MDEDIGYDITKILVILSIITFAIVIFAKINTEEIRNLITKNIEERQEKIKEEESKKLDDGIYIWTDPETGVEYIIWEGYRKGGITPRIKPEK